MKKQSTLSEQRQDAIYILPGDMQMSLSASEVTCHLYVSDIGYFSRAGWHIREREEGCETYIVIFCMEGEGWVEMYGQRMTVPSQHIIVIPKQIPHRYGASPQSPWSIYWCHIQGTQVAHVLQFCQLDSGVLPLPFSATIQVSECFERCLQLLEHMPFSLQVQYHIALELKQLFSSIGLQIKGANSDKQRQFHLHRAIEYMNKHLDATIKLDVLAQWTGVSKQHLIRLFNHELHCPPIEYFLRLKMQKAGQLLSLTSLSVKEIAASLGIPDPYYFSSLFKKMIGVSPSVYRDNRQG